MLDGYEKLKIVGKGSFGTATLYKRLADNKYVVLKEIVTMDMDDQEKKNATNEVDILSTLKHPNIIRYFDSLEQSGCLLIVMEYADGGNLAQLINMKKNRGDTFKEKGILDIFSQISSAIGYMHSKKILHRDLKTANIFMNLDGSIKVGDFGISKILSTKSQASTVVGTPYYLSPEMCEGSDYNEKSDVWAIGCILYELATLKKPFNAQTLPGLVQKIIKCEFEDIPPYYSKDIFILVKLILQKNPQNRPSAKFVFDVIIPSILQRNGISLEKEPVTNDYIPEKRSVLYEMRGFCDERIVTPIELPHKKILDFSISITHNIVVTLDHSVYTWGENKYGQLGLGVADFYRKYPVCVNFLQGRNVVKCASGFGFSLFLSDQGYVYSCGNGQDGCLGHGEYKNVLCPKIIDLLAPVNIVDICCGDHHVVAFSTEGRVYTWGSTKFGELGQGQTERRCKPLAIPLPYKIRKIFCSKDATALLTISDLILVCGSNTNNKLGIYDNREKIATFQIFRHNFGKIKWISLGTKHTVIINENGDLFTVGDNSDGQLGTGDHLVSRNPQNIKLENKVLLSTCSSTFTAVADSKHVIWFWGSYLKTLNNKYDNSFDSEKTLTSKFQSIVGLQHRQTPQKSDWCNGNFEKHWIKHPTSILALYSSEENISKGNKITIANIKAKENSLFILIETTCPPPNKTFSPSQTQNVNSVSRPDFTTTNILNIPNSV